MLLPHADPPAVIAHRGASAYAPEHTLAAYELALELGADVLELDVRATADGQLVVLHDATLQRTAGDPRALRDVTLLELRRLPPERRPPTLGAVLGRFGAATRYLLDLKDPVAPEVTAAVAAHGLPARVGLQAFSRRVLRQVPACDAAAELAQLYPAGASSARIQLDLPRVASFAQGIGPDVRSVDAALVRAAHARGLAVRPHTVNDEADMHRLLALGVDGLITDAPDRARAATDATAVALAAAA